MAAIVECLSVEEKKLVALMKANTTEANLDEYGHFGKLKEAIDKEKAKAYFEALERGTIPQFRVNMKAATLLREFILKDGCELEGGDGACE